MTIKLKKRIIVLGTVLFMGMTAFTSHAATYTYLLSGDYADAGVWGSANINSSAFSYGGGLVGQYSNAASGTFKFQRSGGGKTYADKKLSKDYKVISTTTKQASQADKKGLTLTVQLAGDKEKTGTISIK